MRENQLKIRIAGAALSLVMIGMGYVFIIMTILCVIHVTEGPG